MEKEISQSPTTTPKINTLQPNHQLLDKKQLDTFYEEYKNKILAASQEKFLDSFKEQIQKLNELEILIARLEKFDKSSVEMRTNFQNYITTAKKVFYKFKQLLEESEIKLNESNLRNITYLKYSLSLKLGFFCRKVKMLEEEKYFNDYVS